MFRLLKLKPPNGWSAVAWELGIVTLGVLIALGAQQWVEGRSSTAKARLAAAAIRNELADHYYWSVEWRVVSPCVIAQIDELTQRLLSSGTRLNSAPTYSDQGFLTYVVRLPSKDYQDSAWRSTINDGISSHLDQKLRSKLSAHYTQALTLMALTARNDDADHALLSLSKPIPLDPMVRFSLLRTLNELRGRVAFMDVQSGQLIDHIQKVGMVPPADGVRAEVERWGTYKFCRSHRLPMRSLRDASTAVSN
ncbi:MAG: hypothetical protein M3Q57_02775 [Pseudomonadota bacterium]|nr:hypothetical protein [Pseudomonadota bacterium]